MLNKLIEAWRSPGKNPLTWNLLSYYHEQEKQIYLMSPKLIHLVLLCDCCLKTGKNPANYTLGLINLSCAEFSCGHAWAANDVVCLHFKCQNEREEMISCCTFAEMSRWLHRNETICARTDWMNRKMLINCEDCSRLKHRHCSLNVSLMCSYLDQFSMTAESRNQSRTDGVFFPDIFRRLLCCLQLNWTE